MHTMNRAFVAVMVGLMINTSLSLAASRDAQWKEVEETLKKGLPKTAIEKLEQIIQAALQDKAWGEATKAIARKIVLEGTTEGNKPEEKITRLVAVHFWPVEKNEALTTFSTADPKSASASTTVGFLPPISS